MLTPYEWNRPPFWVTASNTPTAAPSATTARRSVSFLPLRMSVPSDNSPELPKQNSPPPPVILSSRPDARPVVDQSER